LVKDSHTKGDKAKPVLVLRRYVLKYLGRKCHEMYAILAQQKEVNNIISTYIEEISKNKEDTQLTNKHMKRCLSLYVTMICKLK
jgi:hypothetical protein